MRQDQEPVENVAIREIKERSDVVEIVVLVSNVHDRETARSGQRISDETLTIPL